MTVLWEPSQSLIENANLTKFMNSLNQNGSSFSSYQELYDWSINDPAEFWNALLDYLPINYQGSVADKMIPGDHMTDTKWFNGITLNFAENLCQNQSDELAIIDHQPHAETVEITFNQLREQVASLAHHLKQFGVQKGDRVAAIVTNGYEAIVGMLATTSLGGVWSSCSPDFGKKGICDRFTQIEPKILISMSGYYDGGEYQSIIEKYNEIKRELPTVKAFLRCNLTVQDNELSENEYDFYSLINDKDKPLTFEPMSFGDPLYILFSSGTTGKPKSIIHSVGGTLIQHLKELYLHTNLTEQDTLFYYTTCGWMMWNWMVSALALGTTIVCYSDSPFHPEKHHVWDMIDQYNISVFGTSAAFLAVSEKKKVKPADSHKLGSLKAILSTGSALSDASFDYVYRDIKKDVLLSSISGGTDIVSCFALGNPLLPVVKGELQCLGLGMAVECWDESGSPVVNQTGELVCTKAFPSMPIGFWNDANKEKYLNSYFENGSKVWVHGDYCMVSEAGGVRMLGRSDTTLNPNGIRIGTAEIYAVVEKMPEIKDSICCSLKTEKGEKIYLWVVLSDNEKTLDNDLKKEIRQQLTLQCSQAHAPYRINAVSEVPYTRSGKKVEKIIKQKLSTDSLNNVESLANPNCLAEFVL